ncbi:MAG: AMP-binding protein, partial [Alphaproteobacteria bacterium]|nr:AMP-binding protein [Alphaproteobacteria bacterium]
MTERREEEKVVTVLEGCDTVPKLFLHRTRAHPERIAMREKYLGIWRSVTWGEYGERAKWTGLGLVALGFAKGEVTSIVAENIPEWLYTDMGTQGVGGVTNGIYTTDSAKQVEYIVNDSRTRFFFAENEEQLDKILEVRERCPTLEKIFVYDMEGLADFHDPGVMSFAELLEIGRRHEQDNPGLWEKLVAETGPHDLAILVYTSGTTGPPKGAMIAQRNIMFQVSNADALVEPYETDQTLSFLPLCHVAERTFSVFFPLAKGSTINFAESIETVPENVRELQPTLFFAVPRIWEKFYSGVAIRIKEATPLAQLAYRWAIGIGMRLAEARLEGRSVSPATRLAFRLADWLVLGNIKRMLGCGRARVLGTGAAPISPDLIKWYMALGLDMREVYGQTENTGLATVMPGERIKLGTVGRAARGTQVAVSPQGEILLRGPHVFMGYLNNPGRTAETIVDGWLHTGDVGYIDNEGYVKITDRMKDIIITAGGKNITPSEIENQLKFSPYISDAVVIGDQRKFLTCLIMIDHDNVEKFAQDHNVPFTNFASLCRAKEVQDLIWSEIEKVNRNFAR